MTFCHGLKLSASAGKMWQTDCANTEGLFRIIQSIPSPKAEPFKRWLGEAATTEIARKQDAQGFGENKVAAKNGGEISGDARKKLEIETGDQVEVRKTI